MDIDIRLPYDADIAKAKTILEKSLSTANDVLQDPDLRIGVSALEEEFYILTVNAWTKAHGFYDTKISMNEKIITELKAGGIKFPAME
jgi:small conductance mechanosensitive channel